MPIALFTRGHAADIYYFLYHAGLVFALPWLAILWHDNGLTGSQIGLISCVRPFAGFVSGQLLVGVADSRRWHVSITVVTYIISLAARSSTALATGFVAHLLLVLASEASYSPFMIITDAAIAGATDEAGYGRTRVLASLGWGAMAPLSGWIVGRYGVPRSLAVYLGLVTAALLPLVLLPLKELGLKRGSSATQEVEQSCQAAQPLSRSSAALLLPGGGSSSSTGDLDSQKYDSSAAELSIELASVPGTAGAGSKERVPAVPLTANGVLLDRLNSKLAQAEAPGLTLKPLLTTSDEEEASDVGAAAADAAAAGTPLAPAAPGQDSWSIAAVGSPLAAQRSSLPPIACPQGYPPHGTSPVARHPLSATPGHSSAGEGFGGTPWSYSTRDGGTSALARTTSGGAAHLPLARTTSAATTAYYSVRSGTSSAQGMSGAGGSLSGMAGGIGRLSPRGELARGLPRPTLFRQHSDAATWATAGSVPTTPRTVPGAAGAAESGAQLQRQQSGLQHQESNMSQALNGFDLSTLGSPGSDGNFLTPRADSSPPAAFSSSPLESVDRQLRHRTAAKSPLLAALRLPYGGATSAAVTAAGEEAARQPLLSESREAGGHPAVMLSISGEAGAGGEADPAAKQRADLSVWGGVKQLLSNPHHAAFFATTFLMGIGFGVLGYFNLYLKESGASGILIGLSLTVSTCGEIPLFATSGWWLPKLGHDLAFNIGMAGFVVRLAIYTLLTLFPSVWWVLPVELLQGLTFAVAYGVGTVHAKSIAPPHLRSTVQSMFFCLYYGVGPGISGLAGGYIYESMGMRWVFIIGSATLAVGWAVIQLALRWATHHERAERAAAAELAI